jgi:hypothetical protein
MDLRVLPSQVTIGTGSLLLHLRKISGDRDQFHGLLSVRPSYVLHVLDKCQSVKEIRFSGRSHQVDESNRSVEVDWTRGTTWGISRIAEGRHMLDTCDPRLPIVLRGASVFQGPTQMTRVDGRIITDAPASGFESQSQTRTEKRFLS